jgi:hypothetical protein
LRLIKVTFHGKYEMSRLSIWLFRLLAFQSLSVSLFAQPAPPPAGQLNIVVLEGAGGINNIRARTGQAPAVRVEDEQKHVIPGAVVVFLLPSQGPSGSFSKGDKTLTVTTDAQGQAAAVGLKPNSMSGQVDIRVNASYQGRTARATITQFNMAVPSAKGGSGKIVIILAIAGAAAAGGAIASMHKGGSSSSVAPVAPAPIGITPGTGTIGPPQ